ncbi:MAG TPA: YajQ family cyclic di-GMP-binding protein [Actinobacteria bacterium]|nr:YajQ family cyclic di-GMP-binding protein [Actinomycetes bacterium]HEX21395.1 YajQ family cyclic di-GMP-binding protein [Actinomycetota bacterium]
MAKNNTFDIVSVLDMQEVDNAVNQARKEVVTRYDLKKTNTVIELDSEEGKILITTDNDFTLRSVVDIIKSKAVHRKISLKALEIDKIEPAAAGRVRQTVNLVQGIPMEKSKEINRLIKSAKLKVSVAIEGDKLRVSSKSRDLLQEVMTLVKKADLNIPLQFVNFR